jgi:hypothetical protein
MRLEGRRPQLWEVLRDAEAAGLVERFKARACCGRCAHYNFAALKCWKRPQLEVLSPVNTAVCPDFAWAEVPDEAAAEMIRFDGLDGEVSSAKKRRRRAASVTLAWWGESNE